MLPEVERLTDELESHLTYEEEQLIPILIIRSDNIDA